MLNWHIAVFYARTRLDYKIDRSFSLELELEFGNLIYKQAIGNSRLVARILSVIWSRSVRLKFKVIQFVLPAQLYDCTKYETYLEIFFLLLLFLFIEP